MFASHIHNHIHNRTPTSANYGHVSPFEYLTNEVPNLSHLRVPFCTSYVAQAKGQLGCLDPRAVEGIFVGYSEDTRDGVWTHYMPSTKSVQTSRHAMFNEHAYFSTVGLTDEVKAARVAALAKGIAALDSKPAPKSAKSTPPLIAAEAMNDDHYFVCNASQIDKASPYIRDRCIGFHGKRISVVLGSKYKQGLKWKSYPQSGLAY